ncbi:MAG: alpha-(1-_3)-arabinofuranosyltransferase family protein [Streptosporangiaceae bacterium]
MSGPTGGVDVAATTPPMLSTGMPARPASRKHQGMRYDGRLFLFAFLIALAVFCANDTGRIIFDTKLGVDIDAGEFLRRLWSLWNPLEWFGSLQDQYIGYAIPMAPFFLVGQLLHVPIWLIERLWLALIIAVGFTGIVKLARALQIGTDSTRVLAGAVFALWPAFTILIGSTSAATLPGLVAPWAVLPLVSAVQGRTKPGRAAARSGLAIAAMGGVNAVATLAVLLLPALYIVTHSTGRRRVELSLKWAAAALAATAWWVIPLLLQGRYSFNFLPYIEQSATTARTMSAAAVLRGAGAWTAYLNLGGTPWLAAGWTMVAAPAAILAAAVAAAVGLGGLARRDMPERGWLCICVGLAAAMALAGYYGPLGGPWHAAVNTALDGQLAPLRSLYKLEPVIAAALALGCAHAMSRLWRLTVPISRSTRLAGSAASAPVVALVLVGLALPQLGGHALQAGAFTRIPAYWSKVSAYLAAHSPRQTALVVPADAHGQFTWGDTIDNPLEPLATSPWAERGLVPYGGAGSQILLETAEQAVESGEQVPGFPAYLARAGIRYVVVRNDASPSLGGYTSPQVVNETLAQSGFRRVAAFGPGVAASGEYPAVAGLAPGFATSYPAVEIFEATSPALRPASPVVALPVSKTVLVNGGPDALLQLAAQGVLTSQPTVIAGQKLAGTPSLWAITDGQRRVDNDFGSTSNFQSFTYTANETNPVDDPLGGAGGPPRQLLPVPASGHQTVAVLTGAASVTASSDGSWLGESPQFDPVNAVDGNPGTAWAESDPTTPVGQWLQINFGGTIDLPARVGIQLLDDTYLRSIANQLRVTTSAGSVTTEMAGTGNVQPLRVPAGPARWLRITITGASDVVPGDPGAGISDVLIPGVRVTRYLQPAQSAAGANAPAVIYSFSQPAPSPFGQFSPASGQLDRMFRTTASTALTARIWAEPVPGTALQALIAKLTPSTRNEFQVTASSTWNYLPEFGPVNLFRPGTGKPWIASASDTHPQLKLTWHGKRRIAKLVLTPALGLAAAPTGVLIGSPAGYRLASVGLAGTVQVSPPLRTDKLYLNFPAVSSTAAGNTAAGQPAQLPLGLAHVAVPGLSGLRVAAPADAAAFRLDCGSGPAVSVDGHRYQTSVNGTIGDLVALRPVQLRLCSPRGVLTLPAGRQVLSARSSSDFAITNLTLSSQSAPAVTRPGPASARPRTLRVLGWQADSRALRIGPGAASYVEIHENANPGWTATLNGRVLAAATLDGWQQAFIVPAGRGGTIKLTYQPNGIYRAGIVASAVALLLLLSCAIGAGRLRRRRPAADSPGPADAVLAGQRERPTIDFEVMQQPALVFSKPADRDSSAAGAGADSVNGEPGSGRGGKHRRSPGPDQRGDFEPPAESHRATGMSEPGGAVPEPVIAAPQPPPVSAEKRPSRVAAEKVAVFIPLAGVIVVAGGLIAVVVPGLAIFGRWRPRWLPAIAFLAMLAAGITAAIARTPTAIGNGAFSGTAQVFGLLALAAALIPASTSEPEPAPAENRRPG